MVSASANRFRLRGNRGMLLIGLGLMVGLTLLLTVRHLNNRSAAAAMMGQMVRGDLSRSVTTIDAAFVEAQAVADRVAADLASGALPYDQVLARLKTDLAATPNLNGLAVAFEPFAFDPRQRLYQSYVFRTRAGRIESLLGATYDYTRPPQKHPNAPQTAWYYDAIRSGAHWNAPFLATGAGRVLVEYARPFADPANPGKPAGVVTADLSLREVRELLSRLDLGTQGYGFVIGSDGRFLDYPDGSRITRSSIFDPDSGFDPAVQAAASRALAGETVELRNVDALSERDAWLFLAPLPTSGGVLVLVVDAADFAPSAEQVLRELVAIALATAGALIFGVALVTTIQHGGQPALWLLAILFSATCVMLNVLIWQLDANLSKQVNPALTTSAAVERSVQIHQSELSPSQLLYVVPTGVELTALQFPDPYSVQVSGFIWQYYADSIPEDVSRGFILSRQLGELPSIQEIERSRRDDGEVIVWHFSAVLQQAWDPQKFPFDERRIEVRVLPAEIEQKVMLTPDLESYTILRPSALPGLDPTVVISNWRFEDGYFSFAQPAERADLGLRGRVEQSATPILEYAIIARRTVLGPFIAYVLPGVIVLALVFAFLLADRQMTDTQDLVSALSYSAALFFVIALAHTTLRDNVGAVGITYLEHLYILLYGVVLVVTVIAFLLVRLPSIFFIRYRGNILPKLLFWPICMAALLLSTLFTFVYSS